MINNKKLISVVFVSNKKLKKLNNNKNFLRVSNILRNRFSNCLTKASGYEKSSYDVITARPFKFEKRKSLNSELINKENLNLTRTNQILSLLKISSVFKKFAPYTGILESSKNESKLKEDFFPSKKGFIHYWIFPFVGFAGYIYLNKYNSTLNGPLLSLGDMNETLNLNYKQKQQAFVTPNIVPSLFILNDSLSLSEFLKSKMLQNEKQEARAAFFITNFLQNIEKTNTLNKYLIHTPSSTLGYSKQDLLTNQNPDSVFIHQKISEIPDKLLPICQNIKFENKVNKFKVSKNNIDFYSIIQNSKFNAGTGYSYFKAAKLIDKINQKIALSQSLNNLSLNDLSQRFTYKKHYLNSKLIKQINQILTISIKNTGYSSSTLLEQESIVNNTKEYQNLSSSLFCQEEKSKQVLKAAKAPFLVNSKNSEALKNNFHALFLVKYLLKTTEQKYFVNKNLILNYTNKNKLLKVKNQHQFCGVLTKNEVVPVLESDFDPTFVGHKRKFTLRFLDRSNEFTKRIVLPLLGVHKVKKQRHKLKKRNYLKISEKGLKENQKGLNIKMQDFFITLNKIQTRGNLEFINAYKNAFPLLSNNFNEFNLNSSLTVNTSKQCAHVNTTSDFSFNYVNPQAKAKISQPNIVLNNLKWNFYELATLKFLKSFLEQTRKELSNNVSNVHTLKQPYNLIKNSSVKYTKLTSILKTFSTKKNANIVKTNLNDLNLNTKTIFCYRNSLPLSFSSLGNEKQKLSNKSFFNLKTSMLLNRNCFNNTPCSLTKVKATESGLPVSTFSAHFLSLLSNKFTIAFSSASHQQKQKNVFMIFHDQNKKLFIEQGESYLKNKVLNLNKFNNPTIYTSDLFFNDQDVVDSVENKNAITLGHSLKTSNIFFMQQKSAQKNKLYKKKKLFIVQLKQKKTNKKQDKTNNNLYLKKLVCRSQEKIFRAYLSNKYNENNFKTNTLLNNFYVTKTLKKLKKRFFASTVNQKVNYLVTSFSSQKENTDLFSFTYPAHQQRYSPNTFLRKIGLLFKYNTEFLSKETSNRVEKHRSIQKKRRRKKQKRFFPRPLWVRFLLYRNFLTFRHSNFNNYTYLAKTSSFNKEQKNTKNMLLLNNHKSFDYNTGFCFNQNQYCTNKQQKTIFRNNKKNEVLNQKYTKNMQMFEQQLISEKKNLKKTSKSLGLTNQNLLTESDFLNDSKNLMFHSQDYYQISNEVMSDFQKLCWKSYWLRSSLTPYIRRIQKSMQTIRNIETQSVALNQSLSPANLFKLHEKENSNQLNWYLNLKSTLPLNREIPTFVDFQNAQNRAEYERILYDRISDLIENVKANLDGSGQSRAKAFKVGRTRKDNLSLRRAFSMGPNQFGSHRKLNKYAENSFFSRFGLFINNNLNTPQINAFSLQSFMDHSIKPFGDLPTLRSFWALNRTHALAEFAQSKMNTGQVEKPQWRQITETKNLWSVLKFREQNVSNKTKKFFSLVWKKLILMPFTYQGLNNFEKISLQKLEVANKKLNYLGVYLKSNKAILKYWKVNLPFLKSKTKYQIFKLSNKHLKLTTSTKLKDSTINLQSQKNVKRSIQFWWSFTEVQKGFHTFPFQNNVDPITESFMSSSQDLKLNHKFLLFLMTLGGCTVLFHLCSLYSCFQSSQIRSLAKFYILLLYKFSNAYLILVYAIFAFIKNYFKELSSIFSAFLVITKENLNKSKAVNNMLNDRKMSNNSQNLSSLSHISFDQVRRNSAIKRTQLFFYGSFTRFNEIKTLKQSFRVKNHFYLLTNLKNTQFTSSENFSQDILIKNKNSFKLLNFEAFKVRFLSTPLALQQEALNLFVSSSKSSQFSILEMCFYSPNIKLKDRLLKKFQQSQNQNTLVKLNKNLIYSSPKNLKNFISYIITNSKKQKFVSHYYVKKDALVIKKSVLFAFNKSFQHFYSKIWVTLLFITKGSVSLLYNTISFGSLILFKIIDILESLMILIYKFLEKPAEFIIEWIAQLFLVEWSSDITTFVPESFDIYTWRSFTKLSRGSRIFSVFGFLMQRRLWCLFEIYINLLVKPDADLLNRQKKGMIFWDVWAEILITAAEKYRINLSSLTTVKEEQEAFLERLLNDPYWLSAWQLSTVSKTTKLTNVKKLSKQTRALAELELLAIARHRPESWLGRQSFFIQEAGLDKSSLWYKIDQFKLNMSPTIETAKFKYNLNFVNNIISNQSKKMKVKPLTNKSTVINLPFFNSKNESLYFISDFNLNWNTWQRWATNQHFMSQGSDTDLFIDVHPPKSFAHLSQLKKSQSGISSGIEGLPTLGALTCTIYSGLFSKQVSKNILIVGSPGNSQTMLIQALAGETELKIIADNAYRYAHIQRGIAVGMKLLRDVFDGLALHTPCLFLIEDIHVIGERRPMLISDNENVKAAESSFVSENEEVHEKNMFIYQLSKHAITDYRKPYKGDFSLLIPTNHFCFDLFLGVSPPKIRKNGITSRSPFTLETKFYETQKDGNSANQKTKATNIILKTLLQKNSEQFFAPPATSPFNIMGMKEQRQFKAKQIVKEIPWGGFSNDQMMLLPKVTYSIRVKIALLADLAMNQLSVKLDIITDLLVIMDNVRSNRGFVVFATTHLPFVLDPALRRPGRLDETISLPFVPTLIDRFEILKTSLLNYTTTSDFLSYSFLLQNYTETDLSDFISRTKLSLFNNLNDYSQKLNQSYFSFYKENQYVTRKYKLDQTTMSSLSTALNSMTQLEMTEPKKLYQRIHKVKQKLAWNKKITNNQVYNVSKFETQQKSILEFLKVSKIRGSIVSSPSTLVSITYSQIGKFILASQILKDSRVFRTIVPSFEESVEDGEPTIFRNLYGSSVDIQNTLVYLLSGKAGEFFFFNQLKLLKNANQKIVLSKNTFNTFSLKPSLVNPQLNTGLWNVSTSLSQTNFKQNHGLNLANNQIGGSPQVEELWSSATSFLFALIQKRYLYNKTLLMNRLLYFNDISILKEPPSPPGSAILITGKRYENLKRTERDFQQKPSYSILEKIMLHQQQRFIKKLYQRPVLELFQSEMVQNRYTSFNSSIKELGYYDSFMRKPSSSQSFYKNCILTRHKFSFINQWWNGQLAEHNLESTFSSDVDWRSMFVETFGDLTIDFPDADQHYNPKSRRWFLQSTYGGYWNSFEKTISFEVYQHYIIISFNRALNYLHTEREILDSLAYTYLQKGLFKELDLLSNLSRFNTFF